VLIGIFYFENFFSMVLVFPPFFPIHFPFPILFSIPHLILIPHFNSYFRANVVDKNGDVAAPVVEEPRQRLWQGRGHRRRSSNKCRHPVVAVVVLVGLTTTRKG
jgi:hypothetical protein